MAAPQLGLTSPRTTGPQVKHAQYLLAHNRYNHDYDPGPQDGVYGVHTAAAARRAKYLLGYPKKRVTERFGPQLYSYLLPLTTRSAKRRPATYVVRGKVRERILERRRERRRRMFREHATDIAISQVGTHEYPPGSNIVKYTEWYHMVGPWCAMFVSWCYTRAGRPLHYASVEYLYADAATGRNGLELVWTPHKGDLALIGWEHVGIYLNDVPGGLVRYISGNTGSSSTSDGGSVEIHTLARGTFTHWVRVNH